MYSFGATVTLDDHHLPVFRDFDFLELLVRSGDGLEAIERALDVLGGDTIVHAPERLEDGRLVDMASEDAGQRRRSIGRLEELSSMLAMRDLPLVVHPGGVTARPSRGRVDLLREGLSRLEGRTWLENMPSIYHHDGERWHSNLMTSPEEFPRVLDVVDGVVLDVSHAYLSVRAGGNERIAHFIDLLEREIRHVHLSDARAPDREGMQLLEGDIDLSFLPRLEGRPILLEIWGGHLHGGRGFAEALRIVSSLRFRERFL